MKTSEKGISLIRAFEGLRLKAYRDSAGIWTIGYGAIVYHDGSKVKKGDTITMEMAEELLDWQVDLKEVGLNKVLGSYKVTQNQFDALMSFTYNLGVGALETSTLLKKVRKNPYDPTIELEFMKWVKARVKGKLTIIPGLLKRRKKEWALYSNKL